MITVIHGGQTGVDRAAHEAALYNGWKIEGFMPRNQRDELGEIPRNVAKFLVPINSSSYAARTEANAQTSTAALIIVWDERTPHSTPGTAMTIALVRKRQLPYKIVDPSIEAAVIARWIWSLRVISDPQLFATETPDPPPIRLLVAGPRESKWRLARSASSALLRQVGTALREIKQQAPG